VDENEGTDEMKPTILIFLKAPERGKVKTRLAAGIGPDAALVAYRRLVERQLAAVPEGWPVEIQFTPARAEAEMRTWLGEGIGRTFSPQCEGGLGERLEHAVKEAFRAGVQGVLLIGGDCAELGAAEFELAAIALLTNEAVIGPSRDGGYYLLGLAADRREVFADIAWSTGVVAEQTRERLRRSNMKWIELAELRDVDTMTDWEQVKALV
jgi:rSAM/selenodomain-associated transferase 1